ncbi:hypothetical protein GCM10012284_03170 [Mangrovihabitans endophyticus]|uniref:OmpR/PhoB-type domain-containing protein n=2 Tax=Mangrovihabitans endophyticus TaxID=1751298 RepID=A0A8J3BSA1_9ACTN|nr:hypothetical protein GCM10012284_03170 [Mangrovihabitans endophyticus]
MEFRILGPVEAQAGGAALDLGTAKQRAILAVLLIDADAPVSLECLVDRVWGDAPPPQVRRVVQAHLSRIRAVLASAAQVTGEPVALSRRSSAYRLHIDRDRVDLHRVRGLVRQAKSMPDCSPERAALLTEALGRWQGEPLTGVAGDWFARMRESLVQNRLDLVAEWADLHIELGRHQPVIELVGPLAAEHPLLESLAEPLMRALHAMGRRGQALACYARTRSGLAEQLGADPGSALQAVHAAILRGEESDSSGAELRSPSARVTAHRQLRPDIGEFVGRAQEIAALVSAGSAAGRRDRDTAMTAVLIEGMAGVGKTRLALHAAHRLVAGGDFADGQLYLDLGGRVAPETALESLLRLLGVDGSALPGELAQRSSLLRDRLAGRRVLLVYDDAADEKQLEPLLPGSSTCMVVVTSRRALALPGLRTLHLDGFTMEEGLALLGTVAGGTRLMAEPEAAAAVVARCGYLPLAVALAAHRLQARPAWPLAHLADRLRDPSHVLDELTIGQSSVERVIATAYDMLTAHQQRVLRQCARQPGTEVSAGPIAAVTGDPPTWIDRSLEALLDQNLLRQRRVGRYEMHELVRAFAARRAHAGDPPAALRDAPSKCVPAT